MILIECELTKLLRIMAWGDKHQPLVRRMFFTAKTTDDKEINVIWTGNSIHPFIAMYDRRPEAGDRVSLFIRKNKYYVKCETSWKEAYNKKYRLMRL